MTKGKTTYKVIGCMSGTSLDGLDIACCTFVHEGNRWSFEINDAITEEYETKMSNALASAPKLSSEELIALDHQLGNFIGEKVLAFVRKKDFKADFIASHGHTVFHQPEKGFTLQIGNINSIYAASNLPVIGDFRSLDVALGGQGAPLVPVGDELLFSEYDYCLNLGGIANISYSENGKRVAYDICPVNMALNFLSEQLGQPYDKGGKLAERGKDIPELLEKLNAIPFYNEKGPKSLGKEYFEQHFLPLLNKYDTLDLLSTFTTHITYQVSATLLNKGKLLVTGGGTFNDYLISKLKTSLSKKNVELTVPDPIIINFKEALIFGFLGVLHACGVPNCLSSVTGASKDSIGGVAIGYR